MFLLKRMVGLKVIMYVRKVFLPIILTTIVAVIMPILAYNNIESDGVRFVVVVILSIISVVFSVMYIGMTKNERITIVSSIIKKIKGK
jgi:VIT1/CCC1 family predicted Fe2+/Mn2+ transporter